MHQFQKVFICTTSAKSYDHLYGQQTLYNVRP